jgi:hypothetical protein
MTALISGWRKITVPWTKPGLRITALVLARQPPRPTKGPRGWHVVRCDGALNGEGVTVTLPFTTLPSFGAATTILAHGRRAGFNPRSTGIFAAMTTTKKEHEHG